ncbi:MAG: hypothetical protein HY791_10635 [Deltaproteobacteria bacterium]|nr:hypothetical protein [Deltaproteobacteria bacterium]
MSTSNAGQEARALSGLSKAAGDTSRTRTQNLWALAALGMLTLIAFWDVVPIQRGLVYRDHTLIFRPLWWSVREQLLAGQLPILNLGSSIDLPLERSNNSAAFTPLTLVLLILPFDVSYDLFVLGHVVLGAWGAFLLARTLGASLESASLAGGLALSGPWISFQSLVVGLIGLAWAPWVLLAFLHALRSPARKSAAVLGVVGGFQAQALIPEVLLVDVIGAAWLFLRERRQNAPSKLRILGTLIGALGIAVGVSLIDVLPQLMALRGSPRAAGFSYDEVSGWALTPMLGFVELLTPAFFAPPELPFANVPAVTGSAADPPYLPSIYLGGLLPLALAGLQLRRLERAKTAWVSALACGLFVLIALGKHTPLHQLVSSLPILSSSRYAIKYLVPATSALAILAILAHSDLPGGARYLRLFGFSAAWVTASFVGWVLLDSPEAGAWLRRELVPVASLPAYSGMTSKLAAELTGEVMRGRLVHSMIFGSGLAVLALVVRTKPGARLLIATWVLLDLAIGAQFSIRGTNLKAHALDPELASRIEGRDHRVFLTAIPPIPATAWSTDVSAYESYEIEQARSGFRAFDRTRRFFALDVDGQGETTYQRAYEAIADLSWEQRLRVLQRGAVRYVLTHFELPLDKVESRAYPDGRSLFVYEIPKPRAYAQISTRWVRVRDEGPRIVRAATTVEPDVAILIEPSLIEPHAGAESSEAVVIDGCGRMVARSSSVSLDLVGVSAAGMRLVPDRSEGDPRVSLRTSSRCRAIVSVAEVVSPGWVVKIDGQRAKVLTTDVGYLGVEVPAGAHQITFAYESLTRKLFPIAVLSWLLALFLWGWPTRERPR